MALDTVLLSRRRVLAAALESTTGTAATLDATAGQFNAFDLKIVGDVPLLERQLQGGFGTYVGIPGAAKGTITFRTYLTGVGSGSGSHNLLWKASGFTASGSVYTADSAANQSITIGGYYDGRRFRLTGAMGNVEVTIKNGEPVACDWTFTGMWNAPDAQTLITPTYPTAVPPRAVSAAITMGGTQYRFDQMKIALGNNVILREDVSAGNGYRSAWITDRKMKITVAPEALALATQDWFSAYLSSTVIALSAAVGSSGNMFTFASSHLQQAKLPGIDDRNGIMVDGLELNVNNDDMVLTFG
jgi:hypothetical protein